MGITTRSVAAVAVEFASHRNSQEQTVSFQAGLSGEQLNGFTEANGIVLDTRGHGTCRRTN